MSEENVIHPSDKSNPTITLYWKRGILIIIFLASLVSLKSPTVEPKLVPHNTKSLQVSSLSNLLILLDFFCLALEIVVIGTTDFKYKLDSSEYLKYTKKIRGKPYKTAPPFFKSINKNFTE